MDEYAAFSKPEAELAEQLDHLPTLSRIVGFTARNETGTHIFCRGCVAPDDPCFGNLVTLRENDARSSTPCALCGCRLSEVTEQATMTGHGHIQLAVESWRIRTQNSRRSHEEA